MSLLVRKFNPFTDTTRVENLEKMCEANSNGALSLFTDLLGDPLCRIRHSPTFLMLVAEIQNEEIELVGMIRCCIKTITCGEKLHKNGSSYVPIFTKVAYILGLRVSPSHRRKGIGMKLVGKMEEYTKEKGVEYSYIATENDNIPSLSLFITKWGYTRFRSASILVQPVYEHILNISTKVRIVKVDDAEVLYTRHFSKVEFFPKDIDAVVKNKLHLGTYIAVPIECSYFSHSWPGSHTFLDNPPHSWAVLSIWNTKELFLLQVKGGSLMQRAVVKASRVLDKILPSLRVPSAPEVFKPFGFHLLYGLGGEGPLARSFLTSLCRHAHNIARSSDCAVIVTEVSTTDPMTKAIPHWKNISCQEDIWCIKHLREGYNGDWMKSSPPPRLFVDPREF